MGFIISTATHVLAAILAMILLYFFIGYKDGSKIKNYLQNSYIGKDGIWYKGELLSKYDDNCSVLVEHNFEIIKLYCDSRLGTKKLFTIWERGILYAPPEK